jgi:hypothetical protein
VWRILTEGGPLPVLVVSIGIAALVVVVALAGSLRPGAVPRAALMASGVPLALGLLCLSLGALLALNVLWQGRAALSSVSPEHRPMLLASIEADAWSVVGLAVLVGGAAVALSLGLMGLMRARVRASDGGIRA